MRDDAKEDAQAEDAPSHYFLALSLRDGLDVERCYHRDDGLNRSNSGFVQRCRAQIAQSGFHHVTAYNLWQEVRRLFRPFDPEKLNLARFMRALRTGQIDAIGYLPPRLAASLPVLIPADTWDQCQIGWNTGELHGAGLHFVDVRILISSLNFDRFCLFCNFQPVTELAVFLPSEDKRKLLGIAARETHISFDASTTAPAPVVISSDRRSGRPSFKDDILAGFDAIKKDLNWTDKELAAAIREDVKARLGKLDDKGLGDEAILKHVRAVWHDLRHPSH